MKRMDILAHGLWTAAAARAVNLKLGKKPEAEHPRLIRRPLNIWHTTFWGIFPDLFAFTIPFFVIAFGVLSGNMSPGQIPHPQSTPAGTLATQIPILQLAYNLYDVSHSLIVFGMIFLLVWLIFRRPIWELGGWLLHIIIDIPTHSAQFFPAPLLWPISHWRFLYGFSWAAPWFIIANYSALIVVYLVLWRKEKRAAAQSSHYTRST